MNEYRRADPLSKNVFERKEDKAERFRKYTKIAISDSYYFVCVKKCFQDYGTPLSSSEKVCLAKCIDRSYDYFSVAGDQVDPYTNKF
jgi:hypothetical protein